MAEVAIIGAGIIGRSWAIACARAGLSVRLVARRKEAAEPCLTAIAEAADRALPIAPDCSVSMVMKRISVSTDLADSVAKAGFVIEAIGEDLSEKQKLFAALDHLVPHDAVVSSSTSSFGVSRFASDLKTRSRCIVAHPAAPPHLIPVTEIVPAPFTSLETVEITFEVMKAIGQVPVLVRKEQPGFVLNRLQGALLIEMMRTVSDGVMDAEDVDRLIADGFGLRWPFLGPFAGIDCNAPGGISDYLKRYGFMFEDLARERGMETPVVTQAVVAELHDAMRSVVSLADLPDRIAARDRRMAALRALRKDFGPF
jgi:L-gulonate 3-dehydrogenase